jgi:hypothetical protein
LAKKVLGSLKSILKDAKRWGNVAQNVAADVKVGTNGRKAKLQVGKDSGSLRRTPARSTSLVPSPINKGRCVQITRANALVVGKHFAVR